jgi:hypothetical protein
VTITSLETLNQNICNQSLNLGFRMHRYINGILGKDLVFKMLFVNSFTNYLMGIGGQMVMGTLS